MVNIIDSGGGGGGGGGAPQELETFLPQGGTNGVIVKKKDAEAGAKGFDPFEERVNAHPTTYCDTLAHLLKSALGTGILGMPIAFMYCGYILGVFATIFTAVICTHCAYVLVLCAHRLYFKLKLTKLTYGEVAELAFTNGPKWSKKMAAPMKYIILVCVFLTYFGTCSVYTVIVARNIQQVYEYYMDTEVNLRLLIAILLIPNLLLAWIPNLKYLAPVSIIANIFMGLGLSITLYYLVQDIPPVSERVMATPLRLPAFFAIAIFAMEAIGVIMPLENNMKNPRQFIGIFGILDIGMSIIAVIYMTLGLLGYLRYGDQTEQSITLNLPVEETPAQMVKILIAGAVYGTFGLQFYVCLEIAWDCIKEKCQKRPLIANYVLRSVLTVAAVLLAIAVPTIAPFMGLIGAFCFSILGIIVPVLIETIICCEDGFGKWRWILWKNIFVFICGIGALFFGTHSAVKEIVELYTKEGGGS